MKKLFSFALVLSLLLLVGCKGDMRSAKNTLAYAAHAAKANDLKTWTSGTDVVFLSETHNSDGATTCTWRSAHPQGTANPHEYLRLRVTIKP